MIHVQLVSRSGEDLQGAIRSALAAGAIKSFTVAQVNGGFRIKHKKHLGDVRFIRTPGPLVVTLSCKNRAREWQLLEAFIGRLAYHFTKEIASVNIQFACEE